MNAGRRIMVVALIALFVALLGASPHGVLGKTLVIGMPFDQPIPDAHKATGLPAIGAAAQVGDLLVLLRGTTVVPWLAESWKSADGGRSLIFKIREGVKAHDGSTITATDVKWSIERFRKFSVGRSALAPVTEVTVVDPYHVKVTTKAPFAPLLRTFAYSPITVYSKTAYDKAASDDAFSRHPVGPGPFQFVEWIPGQRMVLKAFPGYWAGAPKVDGIEFRTILDEASRIAALEAGEVSVIHAFGPVEAGRLEKEHGIQVYNPPSAGFIRLNMNTQRPPFNDVRVRQAVAYALNRDEFTNGLFLGTAPMAHSLVPSEAVGYTDRYDVYTYNPAKARQLLKEAGAPNLQFTLSYGSGRYLLDSDMVALVQAQLAKVGITVRIEAMEWAEFSAAIRKGPAENTTEMTFTWWRTVNGDPDSAIGIYASRELPPKGNNVALYHSNEFDRLYAAQQVETDEAKRLQEIDALQKLLMSDLPSFPLYYQPQFWAARDTVSGFKEAITPLSTMRPLYDVSIR
jgi:peptide/nickel transport system substrate-binding protein